MEENRGEIREKIIYLFLFRNKRKHVKMRNEKNSWETQAIIEKINKKYIDKSFYSLFFIMFDFIFYYLLTLIIMFIKEIKYLI